MDDLRNAFEALLPEAMNWLRRLVEVNSFTTNQAGVERVAALTAEMFLPLGFEAELAPSEFATYGPHLFLRRGAETGQSEDRPVVLVTHSDTVFPEDEERRNGFHWREEPAEGRIYGPGVVDNKGGTVLIWMMLRVLREQFPSELARRSWLVAANASEEVIADDFARRARERCPDGAEAVLVFEGGPRAGAQYQIVTARKGRSEHEITCEGRAAHAGSSHGEGINAVVALSSILPRVAALTDYAHDLTVNVARISGGTVLNRVPHEARAALEVRAFDPERLASVENAIHAMCEDASAGGATLRCHRLGKTAAWPANAETMSLFRRWEQAAGALGLDALAIKRGGLSDANYLTGLGPLLDGLGPSGGNAHCSEWRPEIGKLPEYVEPASFVTKGTMNVLALLGMREH